MRVAVLGAAGPAGVNTLRALFAAGHECIAIDSNSDHLVYCDEYAETRSAFEFNDADVVIPQPDSLVAVVAAMDVPSLLPRLRIIEACQDKAVTSARWHEYGLREYPAISVCEPWPDHLHLARDTFGLPFWLRATRGAGAKGAILARSIEEAFHWIRFWQIREPFEWIAEEYLPGRDLAWSSVWFRGELITSFARERVEYLYPHLTPEGLTGTPTVARTVCEDKVNAAALAAVLSVDPEPHGIYSVDLREDADGHPRPTEINAGRGFTTFGLWSLYDTNFMDVVVKLVTDSLDYEPPVWNALPEGLTLHRHIDCGHTFTSVPLLCA